MTRYQSDLSLYDAALARLDNVLVQVSQYEHDNAFDTAAKLLHKTLLDDGDLLPESTVIELSQRRALCTSKNNELPPEQRFQQALKILQKADPLEQSENPETLGQAGGIYKRQWYETADRRNLEQALAFYRRGAETGSGEQCWTSGAAYCAINLAFLLDVYAAQLVPAALQIPTLPQQLQQQADHWRGVIIDKAPALLAQQSGSESWWTMVTVAEAWFGKGNLEQAGQWFDKARKEQQQPPWKLETMLRQLSELTRMKWADQPDMQQQAHEVLAGFIQNDQALISIAEGRFGLALSGGGFRASFYHIGVLARLAELDLLRKVEVISCVSGGSIVGALYYLKVRKLLQHKTDKQITPQDYQALVAELEKEFLRGVQTNIRLSILKSPLALLRMTVGFNYSRTHRLGDLYEEVFYQPVLGQGKTAIYMDELLITPALDDDDEWKEADKDFNPSYDNWQRRNKVPILVLNATNLNTGHNWQFTARWMGEAPWAVNREVDANTRLNWFYYKEPNTTKKHSVRLGAAVAASSCVPGVFRPLSFPGLYPGMNVQLVDGGVYDNQGTAALLGLNCRHVLASDASGQMATEPAPATTTLSVPLRASDIVQSRLRSVQHHTLYAGLNSGLLDSACHIHLKRDLDHGELVPRHHSQAAEPARGAVTDYQVNREYQQALSEIRTDLDSFSDIEARSLMCSGYKMAACYLKQEMSSQASTPPVVGGWGFLSMARPLAAEQVDTRLHHHLKTGRQMLFKAVHLAVPRMLQVAVLGLIMLVALAGQQGWLDVAFRQTYAFVTEHSATLLAGLLGLCSLVYAGICRDITLDRIMNWLKGLLLGTVLSPFAWLAAHLHLNTLDRLFLKAGRVVEPPVGEGRKDDG